MMSIVTVAHPRVTKFFNARCVGFFLFMVIGLVLSYGLIGRLMWSWFSIVDDHWILRWLGVRHFLPFDEIITKFMETEVRSLGTGGRFRPVYCFWLVTESWLFGDNIFGYQCIRVIIFGFFLAILGWSTNRILPLWAAVIAMLWAASLRFWGNLWALSFGPAEQIGVFGVSLLIIAYIKIFEELFLGNAKINIWYHFLGIGTTIACGSKENFVIFLIPFAATSAYLFCIRKANWIIASAFVLYLIVPILTLYALLAAAGNSADFYGADNSILHRLTVLFSSLEYDLKIIFPIIGIIALFFIHQWKIFRKNEELACLAAGTFLVVALFWELFFYNGRLPAASRYDFPSSLLPVAATLVIGRALLRAWNGALSRQFVMVAFALAVVLTAPIPQPRFPILREVEHSVHRRDQMRTDLAALGQAATVHPDYPIIVEAASPWDYEPVDTIAVWLRAIDVPNTLYLAINVPAESIREPFERTLITVMTGWSERGTPEAFKPLEQFGKAAKMAGGCFSIAFRETGTLQGCDPLPFHPARYIPQFE